MARNILKIIINDYVHVQKIFMAYNIGQQAFIARSYET